MGKYNSSFYRVKPLMEIVEDDLQAFEQLLKLVNISVSGTPNCYCYDGENKREQRLKPSKAHLSKLIDYMAAKDFDGVPVQNEKRHKLFSGDAAERNSLRQEAQNELEAHYDSLTAADKAWYIFEGFTSPDIFIEGDDYVIVCEGKWTEPDITTYTTHLPCRSQMVRHIQGALNYSNKKVYAFYIVDESCGYCGKLSKAAFDEQLSEETIKLDNAEKESISNSFYGYTTWQNICKAIPSIQFKTKEEI